MLLDVYCELYMQRQQESAVNSCICIEESASGQINPSILRNCGVIIRELDSGTLKSRPTTLNGYMQDSLSGKLRVTLGLVCLCLLLVYA